MPWADDRHDPAVIGPGPRRSAMKKVLSFMFAIAAMGIAMFVVASLLHIDVKAEIQNLVGGGMDEESLPEMPEA
jgi:hypothetical protein